MKNSKIFCLCGLFLLSVLCLQGADLLEGRSDVSKWHVYGGATVAPGGESGLWVIKAGKKGTESGFYTGGLKTENREYVLKVRAKVKSGYLKLVMKHGDNTYGLLGKSVNAVGAFKDYEFKFTETKGGNKSSAWLVVTGEAEVFVPTLNPVEVQPAAAASGEAVLGDDLLEGRSDVSKWHVYGGATVAPGGEEGLWVIKAGKKGTESGFYTGGLKTENREYVLKVRAKVKSGYLKLVMKHGDNTYGLLGKSVNAAGAFKDYEFKFTETKGGNKSSAWLVVTGEAEVFVPSVQPVKVPSVVVEGQNADGGQAAVPVQTSGLLADKQDVSTWSKFGGATVASGSESGLWVIKAGKKGTESGFYRTGIKTENGEYVLKVRAKVKSGYLKVLMKHGNNTYGLLNQSIKAADDFREYEYRFTESKGGNHASVWLVVTGEAEVAVPEVNALAKP